MDGFLNHVKCPGEFGKGVQFSALLYHFVAEILSLKIKDNGDIHVF